MSESWVDQLRRQRLARHLSQRVLAERIGVSQPTLCEWESGRRGPLRERAEQWARCLDVVLPPQVLVSLVPTSAICGTNSGYRRHIRHETTVCDPCRLAHRAYIRDYMRAYRSGVRGV